MAINPYKMIKCPRCGGLSTDEDDGYCSYCGFMLHKIAVQEPPVCAPQEPCVEPVQEDEQGKEKIAEEQQRIVEEQQRAAEERLRLFKEQQQLAAEQKRIAEEKRLAAEELQRVAEERQRNIDEQNRLAEERQRISKEQQLAEEQRLIAAERQSSYRRQVLRQTPKIVFGVLLLLLSLFFLLTFVLVCTNPEGGDRTSMIVMMTVFGLFILLTATPGILLLRGTHRKLKAVNLNPDS